jgi:hypothetical protein
VKLSQKSERDTQVVIDSVKSLFAACTRHGGAQTTKGHINTTARNIGCRHISTENLTQLRVIQATAPSTHVQHMPEIRILTYKFNKLPANKASAPCHKRCFSHRGKLHAQSTMMRMANLSI